MNSQVEIAAGRLSAANRGYYGSRLILALDVDKVVTTANMKNGDYTIAAQPAVPSRLTVSHTAVGAADTLGVITFVGVLADGATTVAEVVTPKAGKTVSTVNAYSSVTSATGSGWTIGEGNDTITIGVGAVVPDSYYCAAVSNLIVTSTNMKVGAYTVAAQPYVACKITATTTAGGTADTMGTLVIKGALAGTPKTETLTLISGGTATTTGDFDTIYSVTGAGWVIDGKEGTNDTIVVGTAAVTGSNPYCFGALLFTADSVVAAQETVTGYTSADLTKLAAAIPKGTTVYGKFSSIKLTSGEAIGMISMA